MALSKAEKAYYEAGRRAAAFPTFENIQRANKLRKKLPENSPLAKVQPPRKKSWW